MLIAALNDYYALLSQKGLICPEGYEEIGITHLICLTPDGRIDDIISCQIETVKKNGKAQLSPRKMIFPERVQGTNNCPANIIEHRPEYIFGFGKDINNDGKYICTSKSLAAHQRFSESNHAFCIGINNVLADAYRLFIETWIPEDEVANPLLIQLDKLEKCKFAFCLVGSPETVLQDIPEVKRKWESMQIDNISDSIVIGQCAVSGEVLPFARLHKQVHIVGGQSSGSALSSYNNPSEESYGNKQSYNSNISEVVAKRYAVALTYLLESRTHQKHLDDGSTLIYWSSAADKQVEDVMSYLLFGSEANSSSSMEASLDLLMDIYRNGIVSDEIIVEFLDKFGDSEFYIAILKPNASRIMVRGFYKNSIRELFGQILKYQNEMAIGEDNKIIPYWQVMNALKPDYAGKDYRGDSEIYSKLVKAISLGDKYPQKIYTNALQRIHIESHKKDSHFVSSVRCGIIKAYLIRNFGKEDISAMLDITNTSPGYLCGRLFAVAEKVQKKAQNMTNIRTSYFEKASVTPAIVFPKIMHLIGIYQKKISRDYGNLAYFESTIREIMDKLNGFPMRLSLEEQGQFIIGYYHQFNNYPKESKED